MDTLKQEEKIDYHNIETWLTKEQVKLVYWSSKSSIGDDKCAQWLMWTPKTKCYIKYIITG